jgi:type IV pilus assembly protein PilE
MKRARGFTLIELMIVVVIIAILAAVALSAYNKQVRKSRRAEAKQVLSDLSLREEKYRSNHALYATCDEAMAPGTCSALNLNKTYYTYALTASSNTGIAYEYTAVPKGDQAKDSCGTLTLSMASGVVTKSPTTGDCW